MVVDMPKVGKKKKNSSTQKRARKPQKNMPRKLVRG